MIQGVVSMIQGVFLQLKTLAAPCCWLLCTSAGIISMETQPGTDHKG